MLRGFYSAASGMMAQQRKTEMLNNNISNVNTPGFKEDKGAIRTFPEMLLQAKNTTGQNGQGSHPIGELATGVYMQEKTANTVQGDLQETGNAVDVAILNGNVPENEAGDPSSIYFAVTNEEGETGYSRNGNFAVDGAGFLTTSQGHYIQDTDGQPIAVGNERFTLSRDGIVTTEDGEQAGQIAIAYAENSDDLVKEGSGLYRSENGDLPPAGESGADYQLQQGFVERSNVDTTQTMGELTSSYRNFESNQKILQSYDQSMQRAVNEVGRLG